MEQLNSIDFSVSGGVARITLRRPEAANSIDLALAAELATAANYCDRDPSVKVVVLGAVGRFFSAGGDLKSIAAAGEQAGLYVKQVADDVHRALSTFARMDAPLIVAVNGTAAGAGFSLAVAGDLVVAAQSASFTMAYTRAGLSPDGGSSYYLPRLIGIRRTQELMLTNRTLTSQEALDWGLVTRVVPDDALPAAVDELARVFTEGAWRSNAAVKRLLLESFGSALEEQMENEGRLITLSAETADGREGIAAFRGKRAPRFSMTRSRE